MPDEVFPGTELDIWLPIEFDARARANHGGHNLAAIGRLKPNTTVEQALADLKRIAGQLETAYPDTNQGWSVKLKTARQDAVGEIRQPLLVLWGGRLRLVDCLRQYRESSSRPVAFPSA
jgi:hypothetical protein